MKDAKEMMEKVENVESENEDDDVKMALEELNAEIDRLIKELNEISPEEKAILESILKVLDEHELKYSYSEDKPKFIGLSFGMDNKPFKFYIILENGKVIFRLCFPFRVQTNAYPLMCMFMAEYNENKAFSQLNIDPDDGELTMEYAYMLKESSQFDEKCFWVYMNSLIHQALRIYTKVAHLSVGMLSGKDRNLYKKLLKMALETLNEDFDDDDVSYGTESLRSDSYADISKLIGEEDGGVDKVASDSGEDGNVKKSKDQVKKAGSVLTMFAKKDEDKESKEGGGNEDE